MRLFRKENVTDERQIKLQKKERYLRKRKEERSKKCKEIKRENEKNEKKKEKERARVCLLVALTSILHKQIKFSTFAIKTVV